MHGPFKLLINHKYIHGPYKSPYQECYEQEEQGRKETTIARKILHPELSLSHGSALFNLIKPGFNDMQYRISLDSGRTVLWI
jgi:hypothetical protein